MDDIQKMIVSCEQMSALPHAWLQKYLSTMRQAEARPSLDELTKLAEWGIKIPYNGPELGTLCEFLYPCIQWRKAASLALGRDVYEWKEIVGLFEKGKRMAFTCPELEELFAIHKQRMDDSRMVCYGCDTRDVEGLLFCGCCRRGFHPVCIGLKNVNGMCLEYM